MDARFGALSRITTDDLLDAAGLAERSRVRPVARALATPLSALFANNLVRFDSHAPVFGLDGAARRLLPRYCRRLVTHGRESVPTTGPLVLVANHPGLCDALALFAAIPRKDLMIIARERPFWQAMPNICERLVLVPDDATGRMRVVRAAAKHLNRGGSLLTFPAGAIEPDPAIDRPGARQSIARWSPSVGVLARLAPDTGVLPVIVEGVVNPVALRNPLTRLRRTEAGRAAFAAMLQALLPSYRVANVRVAFGPVARRDSSRESADALWNAVSRAAERLVTEPHIAWTALL